MKRNKILAALFAAALTIAGPAAAVAGMSFNPPPAHSSAMSYNGHGG